MFNPEDVKWLDSKGVSELKIGVFIQHEKNPVGVSLATAARGKIIETILIPLNDWLEVIKAVEEMKKELKLP